MKASTLFVVAGRLAGALAVSAAACVLLSACGQRAAEGNPSGDGTPAPFVDDCGRSVELPARPEHIVSLAPSISDMIASLGCGSRLVGVSKWCDTASLSDVERIGGMDAPDMERIVAMKPDLVIGTEMTPRHVYDKLEAAGIPCVMFRHEGLDDLFSDMDHLSEILRCGDAGKACVADMRARMRKLHDSVPESAEPVKVALLYDLDYLGSAGRGSWVDDMLGRIGLDNIANRAQSPWPRLSKEALITEQPKFILLQLPADAEQAAETRKSAEEMKNDPVWRNVDAVREGRIVFLPENLLNIPGPRTVEAMAFIFRAVYGGAE